MKGKNVCVYGRRREYGALSRVPLGAGAVLCALFLAVLAVRGGGTLREEEKTATSRVAENEYVAVMLGVDDSSASGVSVTETEEPPGYLDGKWNLWEFIGDTISSFFGKQWRSAKQNGNEKKRAARPGSRRIP